MARKKAAKKSVSKSSNTGRAAGKTQISISLPGDLVAKIDKMAETENRNRSNFIATQMERLAEAYEG